MIRDSGYSRQQDTSRGAHRTPRKRSPLIRAVAAGGAFVCLGAVYEVTAPTVHALSIVFRTPQADGSTNEVRVNVLHANVFDPQLGILGPNVSNNSTTGNGTISTANNPLVDNLLFNNPFTRLIEGLWNQELVFGRPAGSGPVNNVTQISFGSFNIFQPAGEHVRREPEQQHDQQQYRHGLRQQQRRLGDLAAQLVDELVRRHDRRVGSGNLSNNKSSTNTSSGNGNGSTSSNGGTSGGGSTDGG